MRALSTMGFSCTFKTGVIRCGVGAVAHSALSDMFPAHADTTASAARRPTHVRGHASVRRGGAFRVGGGAAVPCRPQRLGEVTLLKIAAGLVQADSGTRFLQP